MIDRIRVRNFRCLRDVDVPLGPLNFLIGPNNTGKSSFLDAVELLSRAVRLPSLGQAFDARAFRYDRIVMGGDTKRELSYDIHMSWADGSVPLADARYVLVITMGPDRPVIEDESVLTCSRDGTARWEFHRQRRRGMRFDAEGTEPSQRIQWTSEDGTVLWNLLQARDTRCSSLSEALNSSPKYRLIPERMAEPCQVQPSAELARDGFGLASSLDTLREQDPERFSEIEQALARFVPMVGRITFPTVEPGKKSILFHEKATGYKVYASEASDGLLLFLGYLTIAHSHGGVATALIEEPETGVNPNRLRSIVHLLRAMSRGELGLPPVQVIVTSHSPHLLDWCSKDEVIYFDRDEGGEVRTKPLADVPDIDERIEDFESLGAWVFEVGGEVCKSRS